MPPLYGLDEKDYPMPAGAERVREVRVDGGIRRVFLSFFRVEIRREL